MSCQISGHMSSAFILLLYTLLNLGCGAAHSSLPSIHKGYHYGYNSQSCNNMTQSSYSEHGVGSTTSIIL
uniref:Uncharacterized protein n=1 Tax=Arion vulgaris TaxID=1028688 RepID=A0A0B6ZAA7_9EUPU